MLRTVPFFIFAILPAQELRVYSEFQRIDPFGKVVAADAGSVRSREILSPALARNGYSSFHLSVEPPPGVSYWLYIGLNPEDLINATLYKEIFEQNGKGQWIPDKLVKVDLPYNGQVPEKHIPGQTVEVFLLDLHTPANTVVRRMKIEPQMWIPDRWITYPMEARIVLSQHTTRLPKRGGIQPVDSPADSTYRRTFIDVFCNAPDNNASFDPLSIRSIWLRNARQDASLASVLGKPRIGTLLGFPASDGDWCNATSSPAAGIGPEQPLRLRDLLLRER